MSPRVINIGDAYMASLTSAVTVTFGAFTVAIGQGWVVPEIGEAYAAAITGFFTALTLAATLAILELEAYYE